jgi:hypothetical protein
MTNLTSVFGDPVVIDEQGGGIGGLGFGFGPLFLVILDVLDEGTRGLSGVVCWGWDQIVDETPV